MKKIKEYLPLLIDIIVSIISAILYALTTSKPLWLVYVQIGIAPVLMLAVFLLNKTRFIRIPSILSYMLMIHLILALDLGSAFGFYDMIACWDTILHTYFGFFFSFLVIAILLNYKGETLNKVLFLFVVFFVTMGAAALWEIYEFTMDTLLDGDSQRVIESIALGLSPVYDTMMDMIVAIFGIFLCYFVLAIDHITGHHFMKYFYDDILQAQKLL